MEDEVSPFPSPTLGASQTAATAFIRDGMWNYGSLHLVMKSQRSWWVQLARANTGASELKLRAFREAANFALRVLSKQDVIVRLHMQFLQASGKGKRLDERSTFSLTPGINNHKSEGEPSLE